MRENLGSERTPHWNNDRPGTTPAVYLGHVIGGSFGLAFILINGSWLPDPWQIILRIAAVIAFAFVAIAFATERRRNRGAARPTVGFSGRYWLIVGAETILLLGGLAIVRTLEPSAALGWIALVVGIHFLPLAVLWREGRSELLIIGAAMTVLGVIGIGLAFTTHDGELVAFVSGVGSGLVLLGTPMVAALRFTMGARRSSGNRTPG